MKKLNDRYLSVNPGPVMPHYLPLLNRRRKSSFALGLLAFLFCMSPHLSRACPNIYFPSCTYTMVVNGVSQRFVNVVIDYAYWSCPTLPPSNYRFEVYASGSTTPFYNSNIYPVASTTNAYILSLGPTSGTPVPFSVKLYRTGYTPGPGVEYPLGLEYVTACGDPIRVDAEQTACVYKNGASNGGKTLLKTTVSPSWLAHAAFMAASGYSIQLKIVNNPPPGFMWTGNPYKIVGNDVYYDISSAPIDIKQCNYYLVQLVNAAGIPESPATGQANVKFCPCTSLACDAEFDLGLNISASGTVASFKSMYQGTIVSQLYTVTNGGSVIYSGPGAFTTIPSGTTTICHMVRTPTAIDGLYDDCEVCKTVCYEIDNSGNPGNKVCDADFTLTFDAFDMTHAALTFYRTSSAPITSESYTVTGSSFSNTYTSPRSVLVPYGSYRVCHTVVTASGESCTTCIDVCLSTESSTSSSGGIVKRTTGVNSTASIGLADLMMQPNPANDHTNISFSLQSPTDLKLEVVDALGRTVKTSNYKYPAQGKYHLDLNTSGLSVGVYIVRLTTKSGFRSERLSVVH